MTTAWVSLGSNINKEQSIRAALDEMAKRYGQLRLSPVYETAAVGFEGDAFYNLVVTFETDLSAAELHLQMREIEDQCGRIRGPNKFDNRTLDADLLMLGNEVGDASGKQLPRDDVLKYAFVLKPMVDLEPELPHPETGKSVQQHWADFSDPDQQMEVVEFIWP